MSKKVSDSGSTRKTTTMRVARTTGVDSSIKTVSVKPKSDKLIVAKQVIAKQMIAKPVAVKPVISEEAVVEYFTQSFGFPVRLYWNLRLESENSSCAKAGTELSFETISMKGKQTIYRVRRGKRNFFTTSRELISK